MTRYWVWMWTDRRAKRRALMAARASFAESGDRDADRRRECRDLDAIRVRFPDHA